MRRNCLRPVVLACCVLATVPVYSRSEEPKPVRPSYNHFSDEDEMRIGKAMAAKIETEGITLSGPDGQPVTVKVKPNVVLEEYLNTIASRLGNSSQRPEVVYTVKVLDAPGIVNALSIPGGHIYLFSGLLDYVQNESELAAVLSHEIGHIVGRHVLNKLSRAALAVGLIESARNANLIRDDQTAQKIADAAWPLLLTVDSHSFLSRNNEIEADLLGFHEMERAGWDPSGEISMLRREAAGSTSDGGLSSLISTHPDPAERLAVCQKEYAQTKIPSGLRRDGLEFRAMKIGLSLAH